MSVLLVRPHGLVCGPADTPWAFPFVFNRDDYPAGVANKVHVTGM